jgi:hypothetical protein
MNSTSLVAVGIVVPVVLVFGYLTVAPRTRSMERLRVAVLVVLGLAYLGIVGSLFVELPVAVVCDRGRQNVDLSSAARRGYFETHRVGPCVTYTHKSGGGTDALIHRSAWKENSPKLDFRFTEFSEDCLTTFSTKITHLGDTLSRPRRVG